MTRDVTALPTGVVTFLFTDLEASSGAWETEPMLMAPAVRRHHDLIAGAAGRNHGVAAPEQGAGDSTVTAFARVSDALTAAVQAQRAIAAEQWPTAAPLRARMAIHTGEVDQDMVGRYVGTTMNRAGRMLSAASGGQLVISGAASDLLTSIPELGIELVDLGLQRLRGLDGRLRVLEVRGDGLVEAPLRTLDGIPNNLPVPTTPLIGRDALLAELGPLVAAERLVCLSGSGGCGKTRLAIELASTALDRFQSGIWWVDLGPIADRAGLDEACASALDIRPTAHGELRDRILHAIGPAPTLVVLDNCEHLLDDVVDLIGDLMRACPSTHLLATSREPLGCAGEVVRRVPSLDLPESSEPDAVANSGAGALLLDRIARASGQLALTPSEADLVADVCRRLDGIPLALELAAARTRAMTLSDLRDGLTERFRILSGGRRDVQARQRTLEASVAWSYDLLTDDEQAVLRRSSVFTSSFSTNDAGVVLADGRLSPSAVHSLLEALVDRSLIACDPDGRLRLLETIRAFAEDRAADTDETESWRSRHLAWIRTWAASMEDGLDGPDPQVQVQQVEDRLPDVRAALRHADALIDAGAIATIIGGLANFWFYRGYLREALDWIDRIDVLDPDLPANEQLTARSAAALLGTATGDHEALVAACERAIAVAQEAQDGRTEGRGLIILGSHATWADAGSGREMIARGRELCSTAGDHLWAAWADCSGGLANVFAGRPLDAVAALDKAAAIVDRSGSRRLRLDVLSRRVCAEFQLGAWVEAQATVADGLALAEGFATINVVACFHAVRAWIDALTGSATRAEASMRTAIDRYVREGELQFVPFFVTALGHALIAQQRTDEAIALATSIRSHPELERASIYRSWLDDVLAIAHLVQGDDEAARTFAGRMADDAAAVGNDLERCRAETTLAILDRRQGEHRRAEARACGALETLHRLGAEHWAVDALEVLAVLDLDTGRTDRGIALLGTARAQRSQRDAVPRPGWGDDLATVAAEHEPGAVADALELSAAVELATRRRGERGRPTTGWDSLTPTEVSVVALVAEGLTNPMIAERLLMGRATVKTHVSNALRKLDLSTRTQLAARATERNATS